MRARGSLDKTKDKGKNESSSTAHSESSTTGKQSRRNSASSMTSMDYDKKSSFMVDPLTGDYLDEDV